MPPLKESFSAALFPTVGRQNWTRLENKMPRDRNNEQEPKKMSSKDYSELSSINCVSTLQEINLLQNSRKPAKFCLQNHMNIHVLASSENNQSFYSIADFFVRFTALSERNVSLQEEKSDVSLRRIGVKCFTSRSETLKAGTVEGRNGGKSLQILKPGTSEITPNKL